MSAVAAIPATLENHAALASRLVRSKPVLQTYFRWLSRPGGKTEPPQPPSPAIQASMDSLMNPLRADCDRSTQRDTESAGQWIGSICEYVARQHQTHHSQVMLRCLAASLMPLYRSLATGRLLEGLTQTKHRLGETLVIVGLHDCLGVQPLLEIHVGPQFSPQRILSEQLTLSTANINYLISQILDGYNQAKDAFNTSTNRLLIDYRITEKMPLSHQTPEWADPQLLWILSNELVSTRSELVLPRSWIETPVPWSKISEHWTTLEHALCHMVHPLSTMTDSSKSPGQSTGGSATRGQRGDTNSPHGGQPTSSIDQLSKLVDAAESGLEGFDAMSVIDQVLEEEFHAKQPAKPVAKQPKPADPTALATKKEPAVIPKVLIGEITNHNDPAFCNVVRRQVAMCKQDDRSVCLSMVLVLAEDQRENQSLAAPHDNGLNLWQQKLVNWMCDHPELRQPLAFLTRDGQLILLVMDTDRNVMTRILRQGLVEVLTGKQGPDSGDLAAVAIPAKFHVGISSTTSPGAAFESDELIASAHRCLGAAQRMGSASIKSIEVF